MAYTSEFTVRLFGYRNQQCGRTNDSRSSSWNGREGCEEKKNVQNCMWIYHIAWSLGITTELTPTVINEVQLQLLVRWYNIGITVCPLDTFLLKGKGKAIHYRPGQVLRVPGVWASQISRQSAHEGGKVVSPTHRPPLPSGNIPGTHFCYSLSQPKTILRPECLCQWKIPMTPSGIEPATFGLVAPCLNQLRHCVPLLPIV